MKRNLARVALAIFYGAIGGLMGFLIGQFLVRPLGTAGIMPDLVRQAGAWAPHAFTILLGCLAALGFLKSIE